MSLIYAGTHTSSDELPTLLHFACRYALNDLVTTILDLPGGHEATEIKNARGYTPLDIATENEHSDIADYISTFSVGFM